MTYDSLSDWIAKLHGDGDLVRISAEVDAALEITEIVQRVRESSDGGPALFFENVKGHTIPVVVNLLGSGRRMCQALHATSFEDVAERILGLIQPDLPENWLESLKLVPQFSQLTKLPPKIVKSGPAQQVVKLGSDVNLEEFPIPKFWPEESAATITAGQLYTKNPQTEVRSVERISLEVADSNSLYVHWTPHDTGWANFEQYRREGKQMPVAVALGGDPLLPFVASLPLPENSDPLPLAGFLREENVELVPCRSNDLEVPAAAEIVFEGMIDPTAALQTAGPIALPTGFYGVSDEVPVMNVTAITHRSNPLFPAMITGKPPAEDHWMGKAAERLSLPLIRLFVPEIIDIHFPTSGAFRNLLFVSIRKRYPQQARKVMNALWSLRGTMVSKIIVVVDDHIDLKNEDDVWFHVGAHTHPGRDVVFCDGPTHMTDHAAPVKGMGRKMGIDATRKLSAEAPNSADPDELKMTDEIRAAVSKRWQQLGFEKTSNVGKS